MFDANIARDFIVNWIREWFEENGKGCNAVVGISGGKDSTIVAALCAEALGENKVYGVLMPNTSFHDYNIGRQVCKYLGINYDTIRIKNAYETILHELSHNDIKISKQTKINLPARLRMAALYAYSQSKNGRVANTCNLSEDWVGYTTKYGDGAGDFSPLSQYTVSEVRAIGKALELPDQFVYKIPTDGLSGKTDEESFGFTYEILDKYIRTGEIDNLEIKEKIDNMHSQNLFKLAPMDYCKYYEDTTI